MTDIHALIEQFLQQQSIVPLTNAVEGDFYMKAGVVPFMRHDGALRYCMMKPHAKRIDLGAPPFQICKGTRQCFRGGKQWEDMRTYGACEKIESLAQTALREGIEELGLKIENIARLFDMGPYGFSSATTGKDKRMWLFAAEMVSKDDFLPHHKIAGTTADTRWVSTAEFNNVGRDDHRAIIMDFEKKLSAIFKE